MMTFMGYGRPCTGFVFFCAIRKMRNEVGNIFCEIKNAQAAGSTSSLSAVFDQRHHQHIWGEPAAAAKCIKSSLADNAELNTLSLSLHSKHTHVAQRNHLIIIHTHTELLLPPCPQSHSRD